MHALACARSLHHQALPHPEPAARQDEAASYLECASCLLVTSQGNASAEAAAKEAGLPIIRLQLTPAGDSGMPKLVVQVDGGAAAPAAAVPCAPLPTDPALMLFTSGTTGKPKQVPITHGARLLMLRADIGQGWRWHAAAARDTARLRCNCHGSLTAAAAACHESSHRSMMPCPVIQHAPLLVYACIHLQSRRLHSTYRPTGALHLRTLAGNLVAAIRSCSQVYELGSGDVSMLVMPVGAKTTANAKLVVLRPIVCRARQLPVKRTSPCPQGGLHSSLCCAHVPLPLPLVAPRAVLTCCPAPAPPLLHAAVPHPQPGGCDCNWNLLLLVGAARCWLGSS